jgi:hypothetical protein
MEANDGEDSATNEEEAESSVNGNKEAVERLSDSVLKDDSVILFESKRINEMEVLGKDAAVQDVVPVRSLHNGERILPDVISSDAHQACNINSDETRSIGIEQSIIPVCASAVAVLPLGKEQTASMPDSCDVAALSGLGEDQIVEKDKIVQNATEDASGHDSKAGMEELEEVRLSETSPLSGELNSETNSPDHQPRYYKIFALSSFIISYKHLLNLLKSKRTSRHILFSYTIL